MKRRVLYFIIVLALVLCMTLPMAGPAMAETANSMVMTLSVSPPTTISTGTLYYTVTLINQVMDGANNANVDVLFYPPGPTGAQGAYGTPVFLDTGKIIAVGETVVYTWVGGGGDVEHSALEVDLGAIPLDEGVTIVYAQSEYDGVYIYEDEYEAHELDDVPVNIIDPCIGIEKYTNGEDADDPTGPNIPAGDSVTWEYVVTNCGDVPLSSITVTDDQGVVPVPVDVSPADGYNDGDLNKDNKLDLTETWTYRANGTAVGGQYANNSTVTGTYGVFTPSDIDPSHYFGGGPLIDVEKLVSKDNVNFFDADDAPSALDVKTGDSVYFKYIVTNIGDVQLTNITLSDNTHDVSGITLTDPLAPLASFQGVIGPITALSGLRTDVATATGDWDAHTVQDTDPANYFGGGPLIDVEKLVSKDNVNFFDADDAPSALDVNTGDSVYFKYIVTNIGDVQLTNITLSDNTHDVSGITLTDPLGPLASFQGVIGPITALSGLRTDVATATGDWDGYTVQDTDPANYFGSVPTPDIDIIKEVSVDGGTTWHNANSTPGPGVLVGGAVQWRYIVENTGNVALTAVTVTDDQGVTVTCPKTTLAVGEKMTCTASGTAVAGQYTNIGTATGTPPTGPNVSDTDPANYFGSAPTPDIDIEKHTNGVDADNPTGPNINIGNTVTWTYIVNNNGGVNLTDVVVTDDKLGLIGTVASLPVGATETLYAYGTAVAGQYANIGTVRGYYGAVEVTDSDPSHYFGRTITIGWETYPVNKLRVLLPWIALLTAIIVGASLLVLRHRRAQS